MKTLAERILIYSAVVFLSFALFAAPYSADIRKAESIEFYAKWDKAMQEKAKLLKACEEILKAEVK